MRKIINHARRRAGKNTTNYLWFYGRILNYQENQEAIKNREEPSGEIRIVSEVTNKTDTLINVDCKIYDTGSDHLLAHGTHIKYLVK